MRAGRWERAKTQQNTNIQIIRCNGEISAGINRSLQKNSDYTLLKDWSEEGAQ